MAHEPVLVEYIGWNPRQARFMVHLRVGKEVKRYAYKTEQLTIPELEAFIAESKQALEQYLSISIEQRTKLKKFNQFCGNAQDLLAMSGHRIRTPPSKKKPDDE